MSFGAKVAVVTGGSSGIGLATAKALAAKGMQVVIVARNAERGQAAVREIERTGGKALFVQADVARESDVKSLFDKVGKTFGRLDCLFSNAGTVEPGMVDNLTISEELIDQMLATNVKGTMLGLKHGLPLMLQSGGGTVICTSTIMGSVFFVPPFLLYGATKAAVMSLTRGIAATYGEHGIRTYGVCPVATDTPLLAAATGAPLTPEMKANFGKMNASGQLVQPEEIAEVVVSLVEGTSAFENGDVLNIDHGYVGKVTLPGIG